MHSTDTRITCTDELITGFTWNGKWVNSSTSGNITWKGTAAAGCDSIVTLKLDVKDNINVYDTFFVDNDFDFDWYGIRIFMDSQNGSKHVMDPNACPIVTKHLQLIKSPHIIQHIDTCRDALPFLWHGREIRGMEDDSIRIKETIGGTDTYYTLRLSLHDPYTGTIKRSICYGDTIYLGNEAFTKTGIYSRTLQTAYGCDSIVTLDLTVQGPPKEKIDRVDICEGSTYTWDPTKPKFTNLDKTDVYRDTLRYSTGCDSIYKVLKLYVHAAQTKFVTLKDTICKGDSLYFYDNIFKTQGVHDVHLVTPFGCDSIIKLDLLVADSTHGSESASFCKDGYFEWVGHGDKFKHLEKADTYVDTLINRFGCDSIVTLTLTEGQYNSKTITPHICQGDYYDFYGKRLSTTTIGLKDTISGTEGCDTIVTLNLTVDVPTKYEYSHSIWEGQKYRFLDTVLTTEGIFIRDTLNAARCDSTVTLHLKVLHTSTTFETIDTCDTELPFIWHGKTINDEMDSGMKDTIHTASGDSIVTLVLNVHPSFPEVKIDSTILASRLPYHWQDTTFTKSGIATRTLSTLYGCDSVVTFSLHVLFTDSIFRQDTVCANQLPYTWTSPVKTHTLTDGGIYRDTLRTPMGMDSIYYIFHLIMKDDLAGTIMIDTACANDDALHIRYQWTNGEPLGYKILFSDNAKAQGFRDTTGVVDTEKNSMPVSLPIPRNVADTTRYPRPDTYSLTMRVDGICGNSVDFPVSFTILYPSWLLLQRWNDMIMLLNEDYNGGYTFSDIRWFHNGENMDEQTRGDAHSYVYVYPNRLDMGADDYYWAELTRTDDGKTICTCKLQAVPMSDDLTFTQDKNAPSIRLSHSTIDANHRDITITSNFSGTYRLYSANGMYLQEGFFGTAYNSPTITIEAGLPTGAYILLFQGDEGTTKSEKLLIK